MSTAAKFKDEISAAVVATLAARLQAQLPAFDADAFTRHATADLDALELKARLRHVARCAVLAWPGPIAALISALPAAARSAPPVRGFAAWPLLQIIEDHGLVARHESLDALVALTPLFSAEFAIRPFLRAEPRATLRLLQGWTQHPDEHVRRLASEGSRPRLPWGAQLRRFRDDPSHTLPLLRQLRADPSVYVRRSVANHLNDLSKDHPDAVVAELQRWQHQASKGSDEAAAVGWITRHALRSLIKAGHRDALALCGFAPPSLVVETFAVSPTTLLLGGQLELAATLRGTAPTAQRWAVDFVVHHVRANGRRTEKVFKWREVRVAPGAVVQLSKRHVIKAITTRRYYPGLHRVELQINGRRFAGADFILQLPASDA